GGYAPLMRFGARERTDAAELLKQLLLPDEERTPTTQEFVKQLPRKTVKGLERLIGMAPGVEPDELWTSLTIAGNRAGMLASDDIAAACRGLARLANEELAVDPNGAVALGAVVGGLDLVRYYLAEDYARLRGGLATEADVMGNQRGWRSSDHFHAESM